MCNCVNLKERYDRYGIKDLIELASFITKTHAEYICNDCGQEWRETYISKGLGELPIEHKKEIRINNEQ